jgi:hypothetical protein
MPSTPRSRFTTRLLLAAFTLALVVTTARGAPDEDPAESVPLSVGSMSLHHPPSWTASISTVATTSTNGLLWTQVKLQSPHPRVFIAIEVFAAVSDASAERTATDILWYSFPHGAGDEQRARSTISFDRMETGDGLADAVTVTIPAFGGEPARTIQGFTQRGRMGGLQCMVYGRAFQPVAGTVVDARLAWEGDELPTPEYRQALAEAYAIVRHMTLAGAVPPR